MHVRFPMRRRILSARVMRGLRFIRFMRTGSLRSRTQNIRWNSFCAVSYTHLDVYKRQEYDNKRTRSNAEVTAAERIEEKSELELFQEFYELQNNQSMTEQQKAFVKALLRGIKR